MLNVVENAENRQVRQQSGAFVDFDYLGIKIASPERSAMDFSVLVFSGQSRTTSVFVGSISA